MQNQSSQWLNVRRDRPDYMIMWGWGAMNPTAVKEAIKIRYEYGRSLSACGGRAAKMMRQPAAKAPRATSTLNFHGVGADFGVIQDIKKLLSMQARATDPAIGFGDNLYNRGV
jgi:branched-chain amino acid transport system substrate-binding protein